MKDTREDDNNTYLLLYIFSNIIIRIQLLN